jgi:hypothetical protein
MKIAVMQPYLFPYIGYFQLISAVDKFVVHDDVQWIKGGWINRNRVLRNGSVQYMTLPVRKGSSLATIKDRELAPDADREMARVRRSIAQSYAKAPFCGAVIALIDRCFAYRDRNIAAFVTNALRQCCDYLDIKTPILMSSALAKRPDLQGQERVLDIAAVLGASDYVNPIGGTGLYEATAFAARGIQLDFLRAREVRYAQFEADQFHPWLSIIDVMMFNSKSQLERLLQDYVIVPATAYGPGSTATQTA